jgi:hypothetical protein
VSLLPPIAPQVRDNAAPFYRSSVSQHKGNRDGIAQVDLNSVCDGYVPYGQPPAVALATTAKVIAFWEFQRNIQDERRKELMKRERDEKEELSKRAKQDLARLSGDLASLQAENKRLRQKESESERLAEDLRGKLSHVTHSKRKLHELYNQLKGTWQEQHGDLPDQMLREESFLEDGTTSDEHMRQYAAPTYQHQHQQHQHQQAPSTPQSYQASPLLTPLASRTINSPLMRSTGAVSPFARHGVGSPQKKALLPIPSPAPSTPLFNVQGGPEQHQRATTPSIAPLFNVQSAPEQPPQRATTPNPATFSGLPPPPIGNSLFARFAMTSSTVRPNSLMEAPSTANRYL